MCGVAIAWTGGKDSSLALFEAERLGYKVEGLVTFAWDHEPFLAHPLDFILLQARALELPHYKLNVEEPFEHGYEHALAMLKQQHGVDVLVTGDIAEIGGHDPNWFDNRAIRSHVELIKPLWHKSRIELLNRLLELRFRVIFSCVKKPWFTDDWLGKEVSADTIQQLIALNGKYGLDICGEQGEYHTLTVDGPQFKKGIRIQSYSKREEDSFMYLVLEDIGLREKSQGFPPGAPR